MMDRYLRIWEIYAREGVEGLVGCVTPDTVFEEYESAPGAQAWHGPEGVRGIFRRWQDDFDDFAFEPSGEPLQIAEEVFAIPVRAHGTGRGSGIDVDWDLILVTRLRDGLIAHQFFTETLEEARARVF